MNCNVETTSFSQRSERRQRASLTILKLISDHVPFIQGLDILGIFQRELLARSLLEGGRAVRVCAEQAISLVQEHVKAVCAPRSLRLNAGALGVRILSVTISNDM